MKERKISIVKESIENTARWILANNSYLAGTSYNLMISSINDSIERVKRNAEKNWQITFSGTAGYMVIFFPEDDNYGVVEILVDPLVSKEREYTYI